MNSKELNIQLCSNNTFSAYLHKNYVKSSNKKETSESSMYVLV